MSTIDEAENHESLAYGGTKQLLSRACYLIRQALDLDGVLFVDAFPHDIAVDSIKSAPRSSSPESFRFQGIPDTPANERTEWLDGGVNAPAVTNNISTNHVTDAKRAEPTRRSSSSELLGYSVQAAAVLGGTSTSSRHVSLQ